MQMKNTGSFHRFIKRLLTVFGVVLACFFILIVIVFVKSCSDVMSKKSGSYYVELAKKNQADALGDVDIDGEISGADTDPKDTVKDEETIRQKYLKMLAPADDALDYKWANDHSESSVIGFKYARDSKAYESIFGFPKPTLQDLYDAIDGNTNLSEKHRTFLRDFSRDWLAMYPDSDLSVFYYNLKTLRITELTDNEIIMRAMSTGVAACYVPRDNELCINKEADIFDRTSNDYVVMVHELLHVCRGTKTKIDGDAVSISFFESQDMGLYEDEALDTYFALQLQGLDQKAVYYTLQSSYYRQLMPLVDYDGNDYMNHSVNCFIEKVQEAFDRYGIGQEALHYINLIDSQAKEHYKPYSDRDYSDFSELYETQVQIYALQHLSSDMTQEETDQAFEEFWEDITFNFENLPDPYPTMKKEEYRPYWDAYVQSLQGNGSISE